MRGLQIGLLAISLSLVAGAGGANSQSNPVPGCWSYCSGLYDGSERMTCHINCCNAGGPPGGEMDTVG